MRFVICGLLITVSGFLFWQATMLSGQAALYPMIVTGGALIFSMAYTVHQALAAGDAQPALEIPRKSLLRVVLFVAIWSAYVLALPLAGFMIATWLALCVSLLVVRGALHFVDALATAAFTVTLAVLMKVVLYVPVPQGWLDVQLEILIYSLR
jgi:hypothetical protein